jgi:hypothetical protein
MSAAGRHLDVIVCYFTIRRSSVRLLQAERLSLASLQIGNAANCDIHEASMRCRESGIVKVPNKFAHLAISQRLYHGLRHADLLVCSNRPNDHHPAGVAGELAFTTQLIGSFQPEVQRTRRTRPDMVPLL